MIKRGVERKDGVEILCWRIEVPDLSEHEGIPSFLGEIAERTAAFCASALRKNAEERYDAFGDPKKRFRYPPLVYKLTVETVEESPELLSCELTVSLGQGGRGLFCRRFGLIFDRSDGTLLSPVEAARRRGVRHLPRSVRRTVGGVLLKDGRVFLEKGQNRILFWSKKPKNIEKSLVNK